MLLYLIYKIKVFRNKLIYLYVILVIVILVIVILQYISTFVRVVKEVDLKSTGIFPHRFESCSMRAFALTARFCTERRRTA